MPNYSGIWTSRQQLQALAAGYWPGLGVPDAQFNYVTMLLTGNGTNGTQNNTFVDGSPNNFTITRNGNTTQGTLSPYGPNWSNYFGTTSDYVRFPASAQYVNNGATNLTIEFWTYVTTAGYWYICDQGAGNAAAIAINFATAGAGYIYWYNGATYVANASSLSLPTDTWTHFAFVRNGSAVNIYVNGVSVFSASNNFAYGVNNTFDLGRWAGGTQYNFPGYISNFRYVNGTAVYTSNFTPPTAPLTAIPNTVLLTAQSNRFIDNSANAFTATVNGTPSIQRFNPFGEPSSYSAPTIGGSGYFDGTGDYLSYTNSTTVTPSGTETFTIECWVYPTLLDTYKCVYSAGWPLQIYLTAAGTAEIYVSSTDAATGYFISGQTGPAASIAVNRWAHIALVRNGNNFTLYVNGIAGTTTSYSNSIFASTSDVNIGRFGPTAVYPFNGYISNLRVVRGTAVYPSAFTPPSSPVTAISGTQALLNMTNAGIIDNAMIADVETLGDTQVSTSVVKYGSGSIYNSATISGSGLKGILGVNGTLTGDYTLEWWTYHTNLNTGNNHVMIGPWGGGGAYLVRVDNGANLQIYIAGTQRLSITTAAAGIVATTWQHYAIVRSGSACAFYVDGVQKGTWTQTGTVDLSTISVASENAGTSLVGDQLNGYMDDVRLTKGYARYTSAFTPPTAAFPTYGPV